MKIGIAFGGGGARGLGHIPVVAALEELGIKPSGLAGTSAGALIGAAYASGLDAKAMTDFFLETFSNKRSVVERLWSTKPASLKDLWAHGVRVTQFDLESILAAFLPSAIVQEFTQLTFPVHVVSADYHSAEMIVLKDGSLLSACAASAALPGIFKPVRRDGLLLADGGLCNPVPFDCVPGDCNIIIGVNVNGFVPDRFHERNPTIIEALMVANSCSQRALLAARLGSHQPDLMLKPPVEGVLVLDFLKAKEILEKVMPYKERAKQEIAQMIEAKIDCN